MATKPLDVHLMIVQPERYVEAFHKAGADILTVHYEACTHLHRTIQQIKAQGMKAGVSLNPHTPVSLLEDVIEDIDVVLLMSVNPGFGGQSFIEQTINKVDKLKKLIMESNSHTLIEIDGGVNFETGKRLVNAGADALVAGSFVFNSPDPEANIKGLKLSLIHSFMLEREHGTHDKGLSEFISKIRCPVRSLDQNIFRGLV